MRKNARPLTTRSSKSAMPSDRPSPKTTVPAAYQTVLKNDCQKTRSRKSRSKFCVPTYHCGKGISPRGTENL